MQTENLPSPSVDKKAKWKTLRVWLLLLGSIGLSVGYWLLREAHKPKEELPVVSLSGDKVDLFAHVFVMAFLGVFFLGVGIAGYLAVLFTHCFVFDFTKPVWNSVKVKIWFAHTLVLLAIGLGAGFLATAFFTPVLTEMGVPADKAGFLPIMVGVVAVQLVSVWFLIWAPLEKRIIAKRLLTMGLTPTQLEGGIYLGLSNPAQKSVRKRFGAIEEDIGMLWITSEQLIYYGDTEQWGLAREQLISMERQVDGRSTTALSGTAHVVLGVLLPDGSERQIRLHTEGVRTMGGKRKAMNELSARIEAWRGVTVARAVG